MMWSEYDLFKNSVAQKEYIEQNKYQFWFWIWKKLYELSLGNAIQCRKKSSEMWLKIQKSEKS